MSVPGGGVSKIVLGLSGALLEMALVLALFSVAVSFFQHFFRAAAEQDSAASIKHDLIWAFLAAIILLAGLAVVQAVGYAR